MFSQLAAPLAALAVAIQSSPARDTVGYWQQGVHYVMDVRLDEATETLSGRESITYVNRSPDTLTEFYLHLYLNAFRPGSRWADRDSVEGRRRFNDLRDPDYAFERIRGGTIDAVAVTPDYPYAPDSTIVRFALPERLTPGDSLEVMLEWDARPSTTPRRQGRRGRRYDFAQWYPRVVTYDRGGWQSHPLYPAGEFYGEFATYDVTFDLPEDQVIAATGVPLEGDPGWERAKSDRDLQIDYQRAWYRDRTAASPPRCARVGSGRKCVRFYAEDVHHFAWSVNPDYIYEEGRVNDVVVRVLYLPGEEGTWGNGVVVDRTEEALRWLGGVFGPYPWPQLTNLHRIEGGGTEFPMAIMDGSPSLGLILHESTHQYLMGILANNEWKQGYLDEGFTSFLVSWYAEDAAPDVDAYPALADAMLQLDLDGWSQPLNTAGEDFRDFGTYSAMTYSKGQLFFFQLRYVVGHEAMRRILREYYATWRLKHVTPEGLRGVAESVTGMDLAWLFEEWLNDVPAIDYALGRVERRQLAGGSWETTVEVKRRGDGHMPVEIGERGRPIIYARSTATADEEIVTFTTAERPGKLMLDPRVLSYDWNFTNNREGGLFEGGLFHSHDARYRLDTFVHEPAERDRRVISLAPTFWWNDASPAIIGLRSRGNYMGRYNKTTFWIGRGFSTELPVTAGDAFDFSFRWENPLFFRSPRASQSIAAWSVDGTVGARVQFSKRHARSFTSTSERTSGYVAEWVATRQALLLDSELWENAGTVEVGRFDHWDFDAWGARWNVRLNYRAGVVYRKDGTQTTSPKPLGRILGSGALRKPLLGFMVGARVFGGVYLADEPPPLQRAIPLKGADPYETLSNPFLRTQGAPLAGNDVPYHAPGNANLRAYQPGIGGRWILAGTLEIEKDLLRRSSGVLRRAAIVAFGDAAVVDTLAIRSVAGNAFTPVSDAGIGVRLGLHVGGLSFPVRVEFPVFVSEPLLAHENAPDRERLGFRWLISLQPIF
ncbi:MAG: M1 family metallopeptidase [Gemmatimonadetes bacterium]|nr:M1 family metallopeptidase [Gemmatimonadota bacterium]